MSEMLQMQNSEIYTFLGYEIACLEIKFLNQLPQTILDKIVGAFSFVFFKVLKNFHNQELTCKTLSVR